MRKNMQPVVLGAAVVLGLAAAAERPAGPVPSYHLKVVDENGAVVGEYLSADDNDSSPPAVLGLLETREGYRAELRFTMDRDEGLVTKRFLDRHSGWWIELRHDFGMRNLGGPEDFEDPMQWVAAAQERQKRERPVSTYTLATGEGANVEWTKPWEATQKEFAQAETSALASLAADLGQIEIPPSALAELKLLASLAASPERSEISAFADLIERTIRVVTAARGAEITTEDVHVDVSFARERPTDVDRLMKTLNVDDSERSGDRGRNSSHGG